MSMDALTSQALKSLAEKIFPHLNGALLALHSADIRSRSFSKELKEEISEAIDLLNILLKWGIQKGQTKAQSEATNLPPDEAEMLKMIENEDRNIHTLMNPNHTDDMSDEDAQKLLSAMDGDSSSNDDMSDEDAQKLLSAMDGDSSSNDDMSDEDAQKLLSAMDGDSSSNDDMSDEDAQKLLSAMDGDSSSNDDMSDEDAQKLLSAMDGDSSSNENRSEEPKLHNIDHKHPSQDLSAEDEAAALLAGFEESESRQIDHKNDSEEEDSTHPTEEVGEIEEWEANDFQTDPDMIDDFNVNADEMMDVLDEQLLNLEQDPTNSEIIEEIFRAAHTLKGAAGMFGFKGLERVMHRMENLFDLIRKGKMSPNSDTMDVMFEGLDIVKTLLEATKKGSPCGIKTAPIVIKLSLVAQGKSLSDNATIQDNNEAPTEMPSKDNKQGASKDKKKEASTIRVDLNRLDALVNLVGELVIDRTRFVTIEEELRTNYPEVKLSGNISETVQLFGRHMNEIQDIIMKVRMVPIGNAFNKYPRIVRDLSKQLGKEIDLKISGETAEMDKTLVEQIGDPLIHLIRNACDHGIEIPEDRIKSGKTSRGTIWLSAHQEGNHIVISIEDDGKGIPADVIRRKGIEKGLITEEDKLSNREIFNLIFEPGFSTAEKITNVSGRGVGMDVVKKQIMKLKGMLEVDSEKGKGSTITIRLPLTLAIVQSLLVRAKSEIFAVPLASVIESIRISPEEIQRVGDSEVIKLRNRVLPLMHLDEELKLSSKRDTMVAYIDAYKTQERNDRRIRKQERLFVVVVGQPDRPFGILVDQLLNQQEMVIKSMGRLMVNIPCVAGGAVLGNGEVVLVLDIPELEESFSSKSRAA